MFTLRNLLAIALVMAVAMAANGDVCKTYTCGDIAANKEPAKKGETKSFMCAFPSLNQAEVKFDVQVCPPGAFYCNSSI
jgi:hypothetical protein